MNQQNQTVENNHSPALCHGFCPITNQEFHNWSFHWFQRVANSKNLLPSFQQAIGRRNPVMHTLKEVCFSDETVRNLISTVGVKNIHARFVIADNCLHPQIPMGAFTIVLYATDNENRLCSAYHAGIPKFKLKDESKPKMADPHQICYDLATGWINNWKNIIDNNTPEFNEQLFLTNYGFINGYNYVLSDFMYALYPPGSNSMNYGILISLAAHEHMAHNSNKNISTFGLVLSGVPDAGAGHQHTTDPTYYDLSLPSPPNH